MLWKSWRRNRFWRCWYFCVLAIATFLLVQAGVAIAQGTPPEEASFDAVKNIWMLVAGILVFFMNAGFAMLETGFCRTTNAINVLAKNLMVFCIATVAFWLFGFRWMFGDTDSGVIGAIGLPIEILFPIAGRENPFPADGFNDLMGSWGGYSFATLFFFQLVFAGTAATIVSGAVAERIKFWAFILFSFALVAFIYPLTGNWVWGSNGWLANNINFRDFAGSTVVHSVGGMAAFFGAWFLGPRNGRFGYDATQCKFVEKENTKEFTPHNLGFATLGCLILWLGWFGFNGGSTDSLEYIPHIIATTMLSAATGGIVPIVSSIGFTSRNVSLGKIINGILGGLVGITASSAYVDLTSAAIIGAVSGIVVLLGESLLETVRIDDPVGAIPVHLFCGLWGTIAVGIFGDPASAPFGIDILQYDRWTQILYQLIGWISVMGTVAILSLFFWVAIGVVLSLENTFRELDGKSVFDGLVEIFKQGKRGIRVSVEEEEAGSDRTIENASQGLVLESELHPKITGILQELGIDVARANRKTSNASSEEKVPK